MKEAFPGYYRLSKEEFKNLWKSALIVLDASVLLDLYRYSEETREEVLKLLRRFRDRLWLPHQAGLEFQRNRLSVLVEQTRFAERAEYELRALNAKLTQALAAYRYHPGLEHITDSINDLVGYVQNEVPKKFPPINPRDLLGFDEVRSTLDELFKGRLGEPFTDSRLTEVHQEAKRRYDRKTPPGFLDAAKPEPERFGDLILWEQTLERAAADSRPVMFVTADAKEDWWLLVSGKRVGPRPELVAEMRDRADVDLFLYDPGRFLEEAGRQEDQRISEEAAREVEEVQARDEPTFAQKVAAAFVLWTLWAGLSGEEQAALQDRLEKAQKEGRDLDEELAAFLEARHSKPSHSNLESWYGRGSLFPTGSLPGEQGTLPSVDDAENSSDGDGSAS